MASRLRLATRQAVLADLAELAELGFHGNELGLQGEEAGLHGKEGIDDWSGARTMLLEHCRKAGGELSDSLGLSVGGIAFLHLRLCLLDVWMFVLMFS